MCLIEFKTMTQVLTESHTQVLPLTLGCRHLWMPKLKVRWVHWSTIELSKTASDSSREHTFKISTLQSATIFQNNFPLKSLVLFPGTKARKLWPLSNYCWITAVMVMNMSPLALTMELIKSLFITEKQTKLAIFNTYRTLQFAKDDKGKLKSVCHQVNCPN